MMRTITLSITALFWVICGITPISSMEEMEAQKGVPIKKATPDGKIDRDEQLYECAKNLQCCLSDDEQLSHIFWVRMLEARLRNAKKRGDEKEYEQLLLLKMKTIYSLPLADFPNGFLFSVEQVGQALDTLGVFNIEAIDLGKFFPFVGECIETFDPLLPETGNILKAYVLHGENVLKEWEYKIEEEAYNLITIPFHLLSQKGNQFAPASKQDFSESVPGVGLDFLKAPMESPSFHVEPVIEIIGNRGMPIAKLSETLLPLGTIDLFESLCRGLKSEKTKSFSLGGQSARVKICQKLQNNPEYDFRAEVFEMIDTLVALEFTYQLHQIILIDNFKASLVLKEKGLNVSMREEEEDLRRHGRSLYPIFANPSSSSASQKTEVLKREIEDLREELENLRRLNETILENIPKEEDEKNKKKESEIEALEDDKRNAEREIGGLREELKELQLLNESILDNAHKENEKNTKEELDKIKELEEDKRRLELQINKLELKMKRIEDEKNKKEEPSRIKELEEDKRKLELELELESTEAKMKDLLTRLERKEKTLFQHERIAFYNIWSEGIESSPTMVDVDRTLESPNIILKHRDGRSIEIIPTKKESNPQ